jgi:hypothetical protein
MLAVQFIESGTWSGSDPAARLWLWVEETGDGRKSGL